MKTCPVCATNSRAIFFVCGACNYGCCKKCMRTYLLTTHDDPKCMNCASLLTRDALVSGISRSFVDGAFREWRGRVLMDRERAMMPSTQPVVEARLNEKRHDDDIKRIDAERAVLRRRLMSLNNLREVVSMRRSRARNVTIGRREFIHRCAWEGCRGFVSTSYKCGTCSRRTCKACNAPVSDIPTPHVCDPSDVASVSEIGSSARKCPSCSEPIVRVSGCDQMWCPSCRTAFSWATGREVKGPVHNPHYYEYRRRHGHLGREMDDVPCGGLPSFVELQTALSARRTEEVEGLHIWYHNFHRMLRHVQMTMVRPTEWAARAVDDTTNLELRVSYMLGVLTDEALQQRLQARERRREKIRDVHNAWHMFVIVASDILRQMLLEDTWAERRIELINFISYTNVVVRTTAKVYGCNVQVMLPGSLELVPYPPPKREVPPSAESPA